MADNLVLIKRNGVTRKMTEKKFNKYFKDKGYRLATAEEVEAHNKVGKAPAKKKADA